MPREFAKSQLIMTKFVHVPISYLFAKPETFEKIDLQISRSRRSKAPTFLLRELRQCPMQFLKKNQLAHKHAFARTKTSNPLPYSITKIHLLLFISQRSSNPSNPERWPSVDPELVQTPNLPTFSKQRLLHSKTASRSCAYEVLSCTSNFFRSMSGSSQGRSSSTLPLRRQPI